jgi:hypothetical protein
LKQISLINDTFSPRLIWSYRLILHKTYLKKNIMKTKITYLLLILPFLTFAQGPWNFNTAGSVEGFVAGSTGVGQDPAKFSSASTLAQSGTDLKVDFAIGQTKSPVISNGTAGIDADTNNFIEIRLKNIGTASYLRVGPDTGGSYANVVISTNDADYKTYVVDVTAWSGPAVGIDLLFKLNNGQAAGGNYKPSAAEYMLIDYIKPLAFLVTPEVNTYIFATTDEGFNKTTRASAVPATESTKGTLQVKYVSGSNNALAAVVGLNSTIAHVEGSNKYAHITLKNTTTNNQFQLKGKVGTATPAFSPFQTFTVSDADYKTYDFDLSTWDSGYQFPELNVALKDTWSATAIYEVGNIVILGNTYYKNLTGTNSTSPSLDTVNWVISNAAGVSNWSATATYAIDAIVISENTYFKNLTGINSTSPAVPSTDTTNWVIQDANGATIWDSAATTYAIDAIVISAGIYYKNVTGVNTTTVPKNDTTNWLSVGSAVAAPAAGNALDMTNSIYIDSIVFDNTAPVIPEVNVFNFNATAEGFDKTTRASAVPATESGKGTLQVKYVSGTNNALAAVVALNSSIAHVEGSNKYAHITLKNTTTNNQFQLKGKAATLTTAFSPSQTFTVSDADYKTYDFDLSTWDSGYQFPELAFAVKDTWSAAPTTYAINDIVVVSNTYYKSLTGNNTAVDAAALKLDTTNWVLCNATGEVAPAVGAFVGSLLDLTNSVYIDSIVFDNTAPALGTTDFGYANNTISLYPNPANDVLNVSSSNKISKIEVYDLLGRKVASKNNASDVNVAALGKGAYIVKVVKENGSVVAKRFIKQ